MILLERKSTATLTGKAARGRMLIADNSVRIPLSVLCGAVAIFVVALYVCVPFGALFKTWGYDYSLTPKWFIQVFTLHHGFEAFADSFDTPAAHCGGTAYGPARWSSPTSW